MSVTGGRGVLSIFSNTALDLPVSDQFEMSLRIIGAGILLTYVILLLFCQPWEERVVVSVPVAAAVEFLRIEKREEEERYTYIFWDPLRTFWEEEGRSIYFGKRYVYIEISPRFYFS